MKVNFVKSIKGKIDDAIDLHGPRVIESIVLSHLEYMFFIEELHRTKDGLSAAVVLSLPDRKYKGVHIIVSE